MLLPIVSVIAGLVLVVKGADWLVDGASALARRLGIAPIVIGLTIVAFGTSMPELVVNLFASVSGKADIAIGNIIGSNIANILLILGVTAAIFPLAIKANTVWKEIPLALLSVVLLAVMASDRLFAGRIPDTLDRIDGIVLLSFFMVFMYYTFGISKTEGEGGDFRMMATGKVALYLLAGLAGLVVGGKLTVDGAVAAAQNLGVSERIIALTVVAVGTSLPELVTSAVAALKRRADIAVGNVVGSNIFNVFWVLGVSGTIRPLPFTTQNALDVLVAIGAALLLFLSMFVGKRRMLERWQGVLFIAGYIGYLTVLVVWT